MRKSLIVIGATVFATTATPSLANTGKTVTPTDKSQISSVSDAKMAQEVRESLANDDTLSTQAKNLKVSSGNGNVTVSGTVASEMEKAKVETIARQMAGNKVVIDVAVE